MKCWNMIRKGLHNFFFSVSVLAELLMWVFSVGICFFPSIYLFLNWILFSYLEYVMVHMGRNMLYSSLTYSDEGFYRRYTSSLNVNLLLDKKLLPLLKKDPNTHSLNLACWLGERNTTSMKCVTFCLEQSILSVLDMSG